MKSRPRKSTQTNIDDLFQGKSKDRDLTTEHTEYTERENIPVNKLKGKYSLPDSSVCSVPSVVRMKPSGIEWLGEVPEHWEVKKLKHVVSLKSGDSITSEEIEDKSEYPVYGGNGLRGFYTDFTHDGHFILIGRQGALCGNINYAKGKFWASEHAVVATPVCSIATIWLGELLRSMNLNQYSVSAAQPGLAIDKIKELSIPCPPLPEQKAIAAFLDHKTGKIDSLISKKQRLAELLKEKRGALISAAVTGKGHPQITQIGTDKINPHLCSSVKSVDKKSSGVAWLGDLPEHWEVLPIKRIVSIPVTDGPHETPEILDEGIPFVSAEAVGNNKIDFSKKRGYISYENHRQYCQKYKPQRDDIYMIKSGATTGNLGIVETDEDFNIWSPLAVIRADLKKALPRYLLSVMNSKEFQTSVQLFWSFGTQQNIGMNVIENLIIPLPPLPAQKAIAAFLDRETRKIDALISKVEQAIEKLKEYRSAVISAAVTGKIYPQITQIDTDRKSKYE